MAQFKHNRKRNSGLVYEFLVRRLSKAMVDRDKGTYARTLEILRKYYGEGTVLAEERELFEVVRNTRGVSEQAARQILSEVQKYARKMDVRKVDIKKSNLIKEVNYAFGKGFFAEHRVPEYRLLASIQMVIDACRGGANLNESVSKIQLEEGLVHYMTTRGDFTVQPAARSEVDALVMRMVAKRFEEKYARSMIGSQKHLLERYIRYQVTGDRKPLDEFLAAEGQRGFQAIDRAAALPQVREDKVMSERLQEARRKLGDIMAESITKVDEAVEEMMLFQKLVEEIESDE